jgi:regulator of replication initiation timing
MPPKNQKKACSPSSPSPSSSPPIVDILQSFREEINRELGDIKQSSKAVEKSLDFLFEAIDDLKKSLSGLKQDNMELRKECALLKTENGELRKEVASLDLDVKEMQQYSRNRNIEIKGVPVTTGENVDSILESAAAAIGVSFDKRRDISAAHRLQSNRRGVQPAIIVQFVSRCTRAEWLTAAKRRKLDAKDLHPSLTTSPVYINEHLTQHTKELLWRAKTLARENRIAFAWCREGKVFVKKSIESKTLKIRSITDLHALVAH